MRFITHGETLVPPGTPGLCNALLHSTLRESPADGMTAHASHPPPPSSDRQPSSAAPAQLNDHISACVTVEKIFLFIPHDVTLKTILKNLTKPKPYCRHPPPNPNKPMCRVPFCSWDWLYYFWNRTGLLSNMLNVKGKETPGKYGKAITENALLEQGKHKAGLGEVSLPAPTYPKHRRWNHVVENSPPQLPTVFIFRFTMGKESEMTRPSKSFNLPYNKGAGGLAANEEIALHG